jgi:hypothetical protein
MSSPTAELDHLLAPPAVTADGSTNGTPTTLTVRRRGHSGRPGNFIAFRHSGLMVLSLAFLEARPAILVACRSEFATEDGGALLLMHECF